MKKQRKCRTCNKEFTAIFDVWYCSAQCETVAYNPVAKFNRHRGSRHKPKKGKGSYARRNKVIWNLENEG